MRKRSRRRIIVLFVVVAVVTVIVAGFIEWPSPALGRAVVGRVASSIGARGEVGAAGVALFRGVRLADLLLVAGGSDRFDWRLRVPALDLRYTLRGLLATPRRFRSVRLDHPRLEVRSLAAVALPTGGGDGIGGVSRGTVRGGAVVVDPQDGTSASPVVEDLDLELEGDDPAGPIRFRGGARVAGGVTVRGEGTLTPASDGGVPMIAADGDGGIDLARLSVPGGSQAGSESPGEPAVGTIPFRFEIQGPIDAAGGRVTIDASGRDLRWGDRLRLSGVDPATATVSVRWNGAAALIDEWRVAAAGSTAVGDGEWRTDGTWTVVLREARVNLADLPRFAAVPGGETVEGIMTGSGTFHGDGAAWSGGARVEVADWQYRGVQGESLTAVMAREGALTRVREIRGDALGGELTGEAEFNHDSGRWKVRVRADRLDIGAFRRASGASDPLVGFTGTGGFAADVEGASGAGIGARSGSGTFSVRDGAVTGSPIFDEIAALTGAPSLSRLRYDLLDGTLRFENDRMVIPELRLDGGDVDVDGTGEVGPEGAHLDLHLAMAPAFAERVPLVKDRHSGLQDEEGRGHLWLKVTAGNGRPRVRLDTERILQRVIDGRLRRLLEGD